MKRIVCIIFMIFTMKIYADTYVYLGINTMQVVYNGVCLNAEVLLGGPSITAQVCTNSLGDSKALNIELGLKYYFNINRGFNIQVAFPSDLFTYSNYSSYRPISFAARMGWRKLIGNNDPNKGLALDLNIGAGTTFDFDDIWPLAVLGIGIQF